MQDWKDDELLDSRFIEDGTNLPPILEEATHRVIGRFPKRKDEIKINGLVFVVSYSDTALGIIHAKIKK